MNKNPLEDPKFQKAYQKALKKYGSREDVTAVDIGYKRIGEERTDQPAIRIHVREKMDSSVLEASEIIPDEIDGIPTDVIEAVYRTQAELASLSERRQRQDPLQPGISVGHPAISAGTLGAIVFDRASGQPAILSNWHVLAGSSEARIGDPILQPGPSDGGQEPNDTVARLARFRLNEDGDAAVAPLVGARRVEPNGQPVKARMVRLGEEVRKSGRTTGVTTGLVEGYGRYKVQYSVGPRQIDGFRIVTLDRNNADNLEISSGGDSGSLWFVPRTKEGVGLHFAGEVDPLPEAEHALACHLPRVLDSLDVSLDLTQADNGEVNSPSDTVLDLVRRMDANREALIGVLAHLVEILGTPNSTGEKAPRPSGKARGDGLKVVH